MWWPLFQGRCLAWQVWVRFSTFKGVGRWKLDSVRQRGGLGASAELNDPPFWAVPATVPAETRDNYEAGSSAQRSPPGGSARPGAQPQHLPSPRKTQHAPTHRMDGWVVRERERERNTLLKIHAMQIKLPCVSNRHVENDILGMKAHRK